MSAASGKLNLQRGALYGGETVDLISLLAPNSSESSRLASEVERIKSLRRQRLGQPSPPPSTPVVATREYVREPVREPIRQPVREHVISPHLRRESVSSPLRFGDLVSPGRSSPLPRKPGRPASPPPRSPGHPSPSRGVAPFHMRGISKAAAITDGVSGLGRSAALSPAVVRSPPRRRAATDSPQHASEAVNWTSLDSTALSSGPQPSAALQRQYDRHSSITANTVRMSGGEGSGPARSVSVAPLTAARLASFQFRSSLSDAMSQLRGTLHVETEDLGVGALNVSTAAAYIPLSNPGPTPAWAAGNSGTQGSLLAATAAPYHLPAATVRVSTLPTSGASVPTAAMFWARGVGSGVAGPVAPSAAAVPNPEALRGVSSVVGSGTVGGGSAAALTALPGPFAPTYAGSASQSAASLSGRGAQAYAPPQQQQQQLPWGAASAARPLQPYVSSARVSAALQAASVLTAASTGQTAQRVSAPARAK